METVLQGVSDLANLMGGAEQFRNNLGGVQIVRRAMEYLGEADAHKIWLRSIGSGGFMVEWGGQWTVVHELAHAWDAAQNWELSKELERYTGGRTILGKYRYGGIPPKGADARFTRKEDFAESVTTFIYPATAQAFIQTVYSDKPRFHYDNYYMLPRAVFVAQIVDMAPQQLLFLTPLQKGSFIAETAEDAEHYLKKVSALSAFPAMSFCSGLISAKQPLGEVREMLKTRPVFAIFLMLVLAIIAGTGFWMHSRHLKGGMVSGILTGKPCTPPCWFGIAPGMTVDRRAVINLLRRMPAADFIKEIEVQHGYCVTWFWRTLPGGNSICMDWEGRVKSISLSVDFDLTVEDIINKYGLPEATNAGPAGYSDRMYVLMNLFYPRYGFYCTAEVLPFSHPVLEPQTRVYEVLYHIPADSLENWLGDRIGSMRLQPWPGYGEINKEVYHLP